MNCLNLSDPKVAKLANKYGEVMASKILEASPDKFPTVKQAESLFNQFRSNFIIASVNKEENDISNIRKVLTNPSIVSSGNVSDEAVKSKIKNGLLKNTDSKGNYYYRYGGKNYTVPNGSSNEVINEKVAEIQKDMSNWDTSLKARWINFIKSNGTVDMGSEILGMNPQGDSLFSKVIVDKVKGIIDYNFKAGDDIMLLSEVQQKYPNIKIDKDVIGNDPIVVVHKVDGDLVELSVFDITAKNLKPSPNTLLFDRFMSTSKLKQLQFTALTLSEKGLRDFDHVLMAMSMRNANSKIRFRHISSVQVNSESVDHSVDIKLTQSELLPQLNAFVNTKEGKEFLKSIPEKFSKLLSNKALYNIDYGQSYLALLKNEFKREAVRDNINSRESGNYNSISDKLNKFLSGQDNLYDVLDALKLQDAKLRNISEEDRTDFQKKHLYMLAKAIAEINSPKVTAHNTVRDIKKTAIRLELAQNMANPAIQYFIREYDSSGRKIVSKIMEFKKAHDILLDQNINEVYWAMHPEKKFTRWGVDTSNERFKRLRRTIEVKDSAGQMVSVKSMMIHFDVNDPETKALIKNGGITVKEVEYGKFLVDSLKEYWIKSLIHEKLTKRNVDFISETTEQGKKELRLTAENEYEKLWTDGMMPIMNKTVSAKLFSGDFKGAFSKMLNQLHNVNALLDEVHTKEDEDTIDNKFMYQLGSELDKENNASLNWGNIKNIEKFGLQYDPISKEITLLDKDLNDDISDDFELISKYFVLCAERKIEYDNNVLPTLNNVKTILYQEKSGATGEWLKTWTDRVIYGKFSRLNIPIPTPFGSSVSTDAILNGLLKTSTLAATGMNIPVGITSAAVNTLNTVATSIAQGLAGSHLYGFKEMGLATTYIVKHKAKVEALVQKYGVTEMNEHDIVENIKHQKGAKTLWNSKTMNWLNYATDYTARTHVMVAQMIKDGTWDAEVFDEKTGECTYDETKDIRLYKAGVLTPEGKALKAGIKAGLVKDGSMLASSDKLTRSYDYLSARTLKDVGNQVVMGMDPINSSNLNKDWLGKLFGQFKQYLNTKAGQLYSEGYGRDESGHRIVVKNEETGELEAKWQPEYFEGKYQTMVLALKELGTLKQKPTEFWVNLQPRQKANIIKLCTDVLLFCGLYLVYNLAGWDDDDEYTYGGKNVPMRRFKNIIKNSNRDLINDINPAFWITTFKQPIALVSMVENYGSAIHATMTGNFEKAYTKAPIPAKTSVEFVNELIN